MSVFLFVFLFVCHFGVLPTRCLINPSLAEITNTFQFSCYDHDDDGSHDFIGYFITTLAQLRDRANASTTVFELINPKKAKKKKDYVNSGKL